jgi:predicted metal-binding membrane protein
MASTSAWLSGSILVAAGLYQLLPVKRVCLDKCRNPIEFFLTRWRPGKVGVLRMGLEHGTFCVGCCWALMLVLFVAGVMNLLWVAVIAAFVFVEKIAPFGRLSSYAAAAGLLAVGFTVAAQASKVEHAPVELGDARASRHGHGRLELAAERVDDGLDRAAAAGRERIGPGTP